ncbi:MAG: hypothetical protein GY928_29715, partial [Colwellia sp.]|nr:hypothetical protein [Colwellia sp.]
MGVLACNRNGCGNIMCDYYSDTHGYLCNECLNELLEDTSVCSFRGFMRSPKEEVSDIDLTYWEDKVRNEFKS